MALPGRDTAVRPLRHPDGQVCGHDGLTLRRDLDVLGGVEVVACGSRRAPRGRARVLGQLDELEHGSSDGELGRLRGRGRGRGGGGGVHGHGLGGHLKG